MKRAKVWRPAGVAKSAYTLLCEGSGYGDRLFLLLRRKLRIQVMSSTDSSPSRPVRSKATLVELL
jgi:hypothetical protein